MKKTAIVFILLLASAFFAAGCNLSAATPLLTLTPGEAIIPESTAEPTSAILETAEPTVETASIFGATAGPTPTQVPAAACPPFAFDSLAADIASTTNPADFFGKHYDGHSYKDAVEGYRSEMLDDVHAWEDLFVRTLHIEFLERMVCRNTGGQAFFEVKDAQILNLGESQSITRTCWFGETQLPLALAIGFVDPAEPETSYGGLTGWRYDRVDQAWLFDLERERIAPLPVEGLVCMQPTEGGD